MKNILLKYLLFSRRSSQTKSQEGFSLIEMMVVTIMIGILSAIAAGAWEGFTSRQRIRTVNGQVFDALRSAQSDAKLKKETRGLWFNDCTNITNPQPLKICKYNSSTNFGDSITVKDRSIVIDLTSNGSIKPEQIKLNSGECETQDSSGKCTKWKVDTTIFFNYLGAVQVDNLPDKQVGDSSKQLLPFFVTVSTPEDKGKRCIIVETLLGGMRSAQGTECP
jgi:prepilin-type N-terminal cleavage/methylation domain-containing protein